MPLTKIYSVKRWEPKRRSSRHPFLHSFTSLKPMHKACEVFYSRPKSGEGGHTWEVTYMMLAA